ncbi:MAG: hypothetical protein A2V90_07815 [Gammaproteobacteria bacterium RBG_16_57_12]|nr:MAG: hypothetical protein A2V90_07815 [Gammaproteobacteria bacterium RBG_16_57_12]
MARRYRRQEEEDKHDRWLISYADFITLLFAFFVVMYAISSINEGKYRVLSDSILSAFESPRGPVVTMEKTLPTQPFSIGTMDVIRAPIASQSNEAKNEKLEVLQQLAQDKVMAKIASDITEAMTPLINDDLVTITQNELWVEVTINSNILFPSGTATLQVDAAPVLKNLAKVLGNLKNDIQVEGYTDNVPIKTEIYPSNWELSAARAANVVHLFMNEGVDPRRMAAIGFGEYRPVGDNGSAEGRSKNRRVAIIILADTTARRVMDITRPQ